MRIAGSLPFLPHRLMVRGETRSKSATSRIVIKSGRSSSDTFELLLPVNDMVVIINRQFAKVKRI